MSNRSGESDPAERTTLELLGLKFVDLATYVAALVAVIVGPVAALELAMYGGLVLTKWVLFVFGGLFATVASFQLRPASPKKRVAEASAGPQSDTVGSKELTRFQRLAAALPPARWTGLGAHERFSPPTKLLAGGITLLAVSWALEMMFGVGVGT